MTITEFLLARIAEDEATARTASPSHVAGNWRTYENDVGTVAMTTDRALAECKAKRAIVDLHPTTPRYVEDFALCEEKPRVTYAGLDIPIELRLLASVYADHPDYQDEWRVG